jgi:hypothetical protein
MVQVTGCCLVLVSPPRKPRLIQQNRGRRAKYRKLVKKFRKRNAPPTTRRTPSGDLETQGQECSGDAFAPQVNGVLKPLLRMGLMEVTDTARMPLEAGACDWPPPYPY